VYTSHKIAFATQILLQGKNFSALKQVFSLKSKLVSTYNILKSIIFYGLLN